MDRCFFFFDRSREPLIVSVPFHNDCFYKTINTLHTKRIKIPLMKKLLFAFSGLLLAGTPVDAQVNLNAGLVMYLPFNGNAQDMSGHGHNGMISGATPTTDQTGNTNSAYYFNGAGSYIKIPNDTALTPRTFTICAKVNMQGFWTGWCYNNMILCKGTDRSYGSYSLRSTQTLSDNCTTQDTQQHNFRCDVQYINTNAAQMHNAPYITPNAWGCLTGTYDGDTVRMYVDGTLRYKYHEPSLGSNMNDIYIGRSDLLASEDYSFKGKIDEIRLYNRVLNAEEIATYCQYSVLGTDNIAAAPIRLLLMPNPATTSVTASFSLNQAGRLQLEVLDITGKRLFVSEAQLNSGSHTKVIDVTSLPKGLYLLRIITAQCIQTERFFKE